MLGLISHGMKLRCLNCGKAILVDENTSSNDRDGEYITCPHCHQKIDTMDYFLFGEEIKDKMEDE